METHLLFPMLRRNISRTVINARKTNQNNIFNLKNVKITNGLKNRHERINISPQIPNEWIHPPTTISKHAITRISNKNSIFVMVSPKKATFIIIILGTLCTIIPQFRPKQRLMNRAFQKFSIGNQPHLIECSFFPMTDQLFGSRNNEMNNPFFVCMIVPRIPNVPQPRQPGHQNNAITHTQSNTKKTKQYRWFVGYVPI